jgi:transketolase
VGDAGRVLALDRFGASAPAKVVFEQLGLTARQVVAEAEALLSDRA